jgi:flagellar biosynthesis/type III secretory pathway M-ring protein FliF/YscJ
MNWLLLIFFGIAVVALIIFLVIRNVKDEKQFEDQLNNDYHKQKNEEVDTDTEEIPK